ncbi:UdgX family uracil-DNA binding protein [Persicimonas caeni]|uniref:Type-4 uracil-DNA glycosylase n=2 Tax=Persicimonas caeni TaxID=2292766 RepID=A0A4Y6PYQ0_PERCE|nr:UdgX family uracil-DNA binding protein [Persicimonas caeni]QED34662.1 UdgX family uracil-DNA binding protein [Persicimonas caeni]
MENVMGGLMLEVCIDNGWEQWRDLARELVRRDVAPVDVTWRDAGERQQTLLGAVDTVSLDDVLERPPTRPRPRVSRRFVDVAKLASFHRDPTRWGRLYKLLWRLAAGEAGLMDVRTDADVAEVEAMAKAVRRDAHKMKAFVRFKKLVVDGEEFFVAWHRPDHRIVRKVAPFFKDRFAAMNWTIMTPDETVSWDGERLSFDEGTPRSEAPQSDELEGLWKTYYRSIFNPARIKLQAMFAEMPKKHWATMPETAAIPRMLQEASARVRSMVDASPQGARVPVGESATYDELREACRRCRACEQCEGATQAVFGEGPADARLMLVGEQPGDTEDRVGRPFVGPAGQVLDRALAAAGIGRDTVYVTSAVKHFGYEQRGDKRIHKRPDSYVTEMCRPWLTAELELVRPQVIVALGATSAGVLCGRRVAVTKERGQPIRTPHAELLIPTFHPAAILRHPDTTAQQQRFDALVDDLRRAGQAVEAPENSSWRPMVSS